MKAFLLSGCSSGLPKVLHKGDIVLTGIIRLRLATITLNDDLEISCDDPLIAQIARECVEQAKTRFSPAYADDRAYVLQELSKEFPFAEVEDRFEYDLSEDANKIY